MQELRAARAYVLTDQAMDFTKTLSRFYKERFEKKGGKVIGEDGFQTSDTDFSAQIERLAKLSPPPDVLFVSSGPSTAGAIVKQIRDRAILTPIVSGDGFDTPLLIEAGGAGANANVYFATHANMNNPSEKVQKFVRAYRAAYSKDPENAFAALGYDTMGLLADAIQFAGDAEGARVRDALQRTRGFDGLTGRIFYITSRRVPDKSVSILTVRDGRFAFVKEVRPE